MLRDIWKNKVNYQSLRTSVNKNLKLVNGNANANFAIESAFASESYKIYTI